jgi:hypothetical protein
MAILHEMIQRVKGPVESCEELSEEKMWSKHGPAIWKAHRFIGSPVFYPVYKYQDYYSYSPLSLILLKGRFRLNHGAARKPSRPDFNYYSGRDTIDREIMRIGGPLKPNFVIKDPDEYARRFAEAMRQDIIPIEAAHPGYTNILLCSGKDSLNLSLLPWRNPVLIASAPPNYDLVKAFMIENGLPFDVVRLRDDDSSLLECEILVNCCRNNLEHCRWGPHLRELSQSFKGKVIFWKGQQGKPLMTDSWKANPYKYPPYGRILQICKLFRGRGSYRLQYFLEKTRLTQRLFCRVMWYKAAMWQGAHMSIIRQLTEALVLSGYHGPAVRGVVSEVDWKSTVHEDLRPRIGSYLFCGPVLYPSTNPGPPPSKIREGISHLEPFLKILRSVGIPVQDKQGIP